MSPEQERFYAVLKADLAPQLRIIEFKGSGQNFNRVTGDVIHAINIQGNPWGGSCIVNLGIHLGFLPDTLGVVLEPRKIREINCAFRTRIGSPIHSDGWWTYGSDPRTSEANARSLVASVLDKGERHFQRFNHPAAILDELEQMLLAPANPGYRLTSYLSLAGTALAGARIHRHNGNLADSRRFAQVGLGAIGTGPFGAGIALGEEFEFLARGV